MKPPAPLRRWLLFGLFALLSAVPSVQAEGWPRQLTDAKQTLTLSAAPMRIVSTSVTLTGSLLAIGAPVIASGATAPGNRVADAQGFLRQWGAIARAQKVQRLYIGEPDAEAVAAQAPDLILVSATGADSALPLYEQLSAIAPTLVINYDNQSWQQLLIQLGHITGREQQAAERVHNFSEKLAAVKRHITLPPQPVSALVYNAAARSASLWTPVSAQGQILEQLGFALAVPPEQPGATGSGTGQRHDIIKLGGENLATALNGQTLFLFAGDGQDQQAIYHNPLLAHLPAVQHQRVYPLGPETFRLDYYSAMLLLKRIEALFHT